MYGAAQSTSLGNSATDSGGGQTSVLLLTRQRVPWWKFGVNPMGDAR
jgi:hypothetical protein